RATLQLRENPRGGRMTLKSGWQLAASHRRLAKSNTVSKKAQDRATETLPAPWACFRLASVTSGIQVPTGRTRTARSALAGFMAVFSVRAFWQSTIISTV